MRTVYAQKNKKIILGRQGEDKAVRVVWPGIVSDWSSLYGDGSFQLSVRRFGDENAYPVAVEVNGDDIRFMVTSTETAIAGNGKCELTYIANGTIAKSATWETVVLNSLTGQTPSEPPEEPAKSWFTSIQGQIGNLANLSTASKDNLVDAINEAAQSGGGGGSAVELDTTLTQSGKAADAKAVGDALAEKQSKGDYLTQDNLQSATDAALAQAKASGEFDGADGKSAYQYAQDGGYTGTEAEFAEKLAKEIPEALPNPNALTFTGAVNATYDGSTAVSVEIPSGGSVGTDISLGLTSATVGQIIKVKAIDEIGKPTAWEAADMPSGGGDTLLYHYDTSEDAIITSTALVPNLDISTTNLLLFKWHINGYGTVEFGGRLMINNQPITKYFPYIHRKAGSTMDIFCAVAVSDASLTVIKFVADSNYFTDSADLVYEKGDSGTNNIINIPNSGIIESFGIQGATVSGTLPSDKGENLDYTTSGFSVDVYKVV